MLLNAEASGSILFVCNNQGHFDISSRIASRLQAYPVLRIGVLSDERSGLIRTNACGFDRIVKIGSDQSSVSFPQFQGLLELRDYVRSTTSRILTIVLFDDRPKQNAAMIEAAAALTIPTYLVQADPTLCLSEMWHIDKANDRSKWGRAKPSRYLVQAAGHALEIVRDLRTQSNTTTTSGAALCLVGGTAVRVRTQRVSPVAAPRLLAQAEVMTPYITASVESFAKQTAIRCDTASFRAHDFALPVGRSDLAIVGSPALAMTLAQNEYRVLLVGPSEFALHDEGPIVYCEAGSGLTDALQKLTGRSPDSTWSPPPSLASWIPTLCLETTLVAEIEERIQRQLRRKSGSQQLYRYRIPEMRPAENTSDQINMPLFPIEEFKIELHNLVKPRIKRMVTVSHDLSLLTGLARPIKMYNSAIAFMGVQVLALAISAKSNLEDIIQYIDVDDFVLFNSLGMFERSDLAFDLFDYINLSQKCIYLHETAYTFERFNAKEPKRYHRFVNYLRDTHLLCVSTKQEKFLKEIFGARLTSVVYNTTSLPHIDSSQEIRSGGERRPIIAMVGTVQSRKGATLFSQTADLARSAGLDYSFEWIGGQTEEALSLYLSPNVNWLGRLEGAQLTRKMREIDLFFLSSIDDPFPLSVIEAIQENKRVVCYTETGIEEIIRATPGCAIFDQYTANSALDAVQRAFATKPDPAVYASIRRQIFGLRPFVNRVTLAVDRVQAGLGSTNSPGT